MLTTNITNSYCALRNAITQRPKKMLKITLTAFIFPLLLLFNSRDAGSPNLSGAARKSLSKQGESGTLQKMVVASGSLTMDIDVNRLNGIRSTRGKLERLHFAVATNSFFPALV